MRRRVEGRIVPVGRACVRCGWRWRQGKFLCRACDRETGADNRDTKERDHARLLRQQARVPAPPPAPVRTIRTVTIGRESFDVVWDGAA